MSLTEAGLCNLALLRVGQRQLIDALTDNTQQARVCAAVYPHARDVVLESARWPFATRRATLALRTTTRSGWEYVYALPADCLAPHFLWAGIREPTEDEAPAFAIEDDASSGPVLLTDLEEAELLYTYAVTATGRFSPLFCDALVARLAVEFSFSIPVKPQLAMGLEAAYQKALAAAVASALNQARRGPRRDASSILARL